MSDDRPAGWVTMYPSRDLRVGQTVKLGAKAPAVPEKITWPQRPEYREKLVRVKVLVSEAGVFFSLESGTVVDLPESMARPRLKAGRVRLAHADERPAGE